jgi:lysozyme family protein
MQHPFPQLAPEYTSFLSHMAITDSAAVNGAIREIMQRKADYLAVNAVTKIPAALIGAIDYREDDCNPHDGLGQGGPWNKVSVNVPAGKGPFLWPLVFIGYWRVLWMKL